MFTSDPEKWHWQSSWNPEDVGYPEGGPAINLYSTESDSDGQTIYAYMDAETGEILSIWASCDNCDEEGE